MRPLVEGSDHQLLSNRTIGDGGHPQLLRRSEYISDFQGFITASQGPWKVFPNTGFDTTDSIQRFFEEIPVGRTGMLLPGVYNVQPGVLQIDRNISMFSYGAILDIGTTAITSTQAVLTIGNTLTSGGIPGADTGKVRKQSYRGLWVKRNPAGTANTDALGIGIKYLGLYECDIADMIVTSFAKGHLFTGSYNVTDGESGYAYNRHENLHAFECRYGYRLEPGNAILGPPAHSGWCNQNQWHGGRITNSFTNPPTGLEGAGHSAAIYVEWLIGNATPGVDNAHNCNDNKFYAVNFENKWGRKIYDESIYNEYYQDRFETGRGLSGGSFPLRGVYGRGRLQATTTAGPSPYTIPLTSANYRILVNPAAAYTVNLPIINGPRTGDAFLIIDNNGTAGANNITVNGNGNTIDGAASQVINTNGGRLSLRFEGGEWKSKAIAADENVDIEFKDSTGLNQGGSLFLITGGYDLLNNIISVRSGALGRVIAQDVDTFGENAIFRTRHLEIGTLAFPSQSYIEGAGDPDTNPTDRPPLRLWNHSSGINPALWIMAANGADARGELRAQAESALPGNEYTCVLAGRSGTGVGTLQNWFGMRITGQFNWGTQHGLQVNVSNSSTGDFVAYGTAAPLIKVRTDTVNDIVSVGKDVDGSLDDVVQIERRVRFEGAIKIFRRSDGADTTLNPITDFYLRSDSSVGARVVTLPATDGANVGVGKTFVVKRTGAGNTVTLTPTGANTVDGGATLVLADKETAWLVSNGGAGAAGNWERL